jgi:hypothetical protein
MSSRAVRKALKRLEAQKGLEKDTPKNVAAEDKTDEEEEDEEIRTPANPFAMVTFLLIRGLT